MSYLKFVFTFLSLRETIFSIILIFVLSEILTRQTKSNLILCCDCIFVHRLLKLVLLILYKCTEGMYMDGTLHM